MTNILITGANGGIGSALVAELAKHSYTVFAAARNPDNIPSFNADAEANVQRIALDICDQSSVDTAIKTMDLQGGVDVLVNNAGYGQMGALLDMPIASLAHQFEVNLFAQLRLIQTVSHAMIQRKKGRIVNIGSVSGITATPFAGAYCASKAALHLMSDSLRMELAPFGIDVVIVQPGAIRSSFGKAASSELKLGPDSSHYKAAEQGIRQRAVESQNERSTPAAEFAEIFRRKVLADSCPSVVRIGSGSTLLPALKRWLPTKLLDRAMIKRFGLSKI
ncbi:MAG: short-subunit dehydrogenase [Pseudoalteromonas tetraodonis]|jgi:short-subunit dehydrogenase